ncbi:hypothetical protein EAG_04189 [Camponotus floridanus]|uniref:Uncharacterized protein n=1 Tax=Camponotus floridanus TaxID=104421 RepID=E2AQ32_CAMFO|nr:hypothetical protein EAG_04189 [Camponotus floridanus]
MPVNDATMRLTHNSRTNSAFTVECDRAMRFFGVSNPNVFRLFILPNRSVTFRTIMDVGGPQLRPSRSRNTAVYRCAERADPSTCRASEISPFHGSLLGRCRLEIHGYSNVDVLVRRLRQRISSSQYANRMFRVDRMFRIDLAFEQPVSIPPVEIGEKETTLLYEMVDRGGDRERSREVTREASRILTRPRCTVELS